MTKLRGFSLILFFIFIHTYASSDRNDAKQAYEGINTSDHIQTSDSWWYYKPSETCYLEISSCGETEEDTYVEVCNYHDLLVLNRNDDYCKTQSRIIFLALADSTYLIRWRGDYVEKNYNWTISEEAIPVGEFMSNPIKIDTGFIRSVLTEDHSIWYSYKSNQDTIMLLSAEEGEVQIFRNHYRNEQLIYEHRFWKDTSFVSLQKDSTYYLRWYNTRRNNAHVQWIFYLREAEKGMVRKDPFILNVKGDNIFKADFCNEQWFIYKSNMFTESFGEISLHICEDGNYHCEVYEVESGKRVPLQKYLCRTKDNIRFIHRERKDYLIMMRSNQDFDFKVRHTGIVPGESRINPIPAIEGVNYVKTKQATGEWFVYDVKQGGNMLISTQYNAFLRSRIIVIDVDADKILYDTTMKQIDDRQLNVQLNTEPGKRYHLYLGDGGHSSANGMFWDLKENPQGCSEAIRLSSVEDSVVVQGNIPQWFIYKVKEDAEVSFFVKDTKYLRNTFLELFQSCDSNSVVVGDNIISTFSKAGSEYLLKTSGRTYEKDYILYVREIPIKNGSSAYPISVVEGLNKCTYDGEKEIWFSYVADKNGKIEISSLGLTGQNTMVDVYLESEGQRIWMTNSYTMHKAAVRCYEGEVFYFKWTQAYIRESYSWDLKLVDIEPGESKTTPIAAKAGINNLEKSNGMSVYYYYVPLSSGKIKVSTCGLTKEDTRVVMINDIYQSVSSYYNDDYCETQSELTFPCIANDTLYVLWYGTKITNPYRWSLTEYPNKKGDGRQDPKVAVEGVNTCSYATNNDQWFLYKSKQTGKAVISVCNYVGNFRPDLKVYTYNSEKNISQFYQDCYLGADDEYFECVKDSIYLIKFHISLVDKSKNHQWKLTLNPNMEGDVCQDPIPVSEGTVFTDYRSRKFKWYSYKAKANSMVTVSTCETNNAWVSIDLYLNCNTVFYPMSASSCGLGRSERFKVAKDSVYLIECSSLHGDDFSWIITEEAFEENAYCEDALAAIEGENLAKHRNGQDLWYSFVAPGNGELQIKSVGLTDQDTHVFLYDGCSTPTLTARRLNESNNYLNNQSLLTQMVEKNKTYYIMWKGEKVTGSYKWNLTFNKNGDFERISQKMDWGNNVKEASKVDVQHYSLYASMDCFAEITVPKNSVRKRRIFLPENFHILCSPIYNSDSTAMSMWYDKGRTYVIKIYSEPDDIFNWNINVAPTDTIIKGKVQANHSLQFVDWKAFSPEEQGYYKIYANDTSLANNVVRLNVHDFYNPIVNTDIYNSSEQVYWVDHEDKYFFSWEKEGKQDLNWRVERYPVSENNFCFDAQIAKEGLNSMEFATPESWFKFRPKQGGNLEIHVPWINSPGVNIFGFSIHRGDCKSSGVSVNQLFTFDEAADAYVLKANLLPPDTYYLGWQFFIKKQKIYNIDWKLKWTNIPDNLIAKDNPDDPDRFYYDSSYEDSIRRTLVLKAFPNPNTGIFYIVVNEDFLSGALKVFNARGELIMEDVLHCAGNCPLDLSGYPKGVYFIELSRKSKVERTRIVVM